MENLRTEEDMQKVIKAFERRVQDLGFYVSGRYIDCKRGDYSLTVRHNNHNSLTPSAKIKFSYSRNKRDIYARIPRYIEQGVQPVRSLEDLTIGKELLEFINGWIKYNSVRQIRENRNEHVWLIKPLLYDLTAFYQKFKN